jgi:hypothetical protein
MGFVLDGRNGEELPIASGTFHTTQGDEVAVKAWLPQQSAWPNATVNVWLQWYGATGWPAGWSVFVHLRQGNENQAQNDGLPRYFAPLATQQWLARQGFVNDWRQLSAPADVLLKGQQRIVIGLYDPQQGERAALLGSSGEFVANELVIGALTMRAPPAPDQACALIPAACAAQPDR